MEAKRNEMADEICAAIGIRSVTEHKRILEMLMRADNDANKAMDMYFQVMAASNGEGVIEEDGICSTLSATPELPRQTMNNNAEPMDWTPEAEELSRFLGIEVERHVILDLLRRSSNNLHKAVEIYFMRKDADDNLENDDTTVRTAWPKNSDENGSKPSPSSCIPCAESSDDMFMMTPVRLSSVQAQSMSAVKSVSSQGVSPSVCSVVIEGSSAGNPKTSPLSERDILRGPDTFETVINHSNIGWQISNVFGRAVVQYVEPGGPAALAGILKSDVLVSFRDTVVTEENCAAVVQELSKERILVPSVLRVRHASGTTFANGASSSERGDETMKRIQQDADGDVEMTSPHGGISPENPVEPKYGLQALCQAVQSIQDVGISVIEYKVLVDLVLNSEFNLDRVVNTFLSQDRVTVDFRGIIGHNWDPEKPDLSILGGNETYTASIPTGPLGLTVENILERTIVVDIKAGGAAERAKLKRSSWLVGINGQRVTHLTHKETLRLIEIATRPLELQFVLVPPNDYKALRRQLLTNTRQQKTERPIPEQDRMSFRVFQIKIRQSILAFPKLVAKSFFQYLSAEEYHPLSVDSRYENPLERLLPPNEAWNAAMLHDFEIMEEERTGEMYAERRFLLNLFASIHDYDDKGESIVIRTIQFLGWLGVRTARTQQLMDAREPKSMSGYHGAKLHRFELLLAVVLHVLESIAIIENHATWDVTVNALKVITLSLTCSDVNKLMVPMFARLSISSSPTARILPVALLSTVYPHLRGDVCVQVRGMLDRMCNDDNPLVRRAVASVIGDLASACGSPVATWTVQILDKSTTDSHDIVRIFAVKSCTTLATTLRRLLYDDSKSQEEADQALRLLYCQMVPMVNTYTSDSSWQVRLETVRSLPALCRAFGADYSDVFADYFVSMVGDPTVEVRCACAEAVFFLGEALRDIGLQQVSNVKTKDSLECKGQGNGLNRDSSDEKMHIAAQVKFVRCVLPATRSLSTDISVAVRLALAQSVGRSLQFIASNYYDELFPIITQLLNETQEAVVRAALLEEMVRYCDCTSDIVTAMIFPAILALRNSAQWRVRTKFVCCVAAWCERGDGAAMPADFADACLELMCDAVHEVRLIVCKNLSSLVKLLGSEWMAEKCIPHVSECLQSTFQQRLTGLLAIELLVPMIHQIDSLRDIVDIVLELCTSKTPNMRFRALRTLGLIVPRLSDSSTTKIALGIVRPLAHVAMETNPEVRTVAAATVTILEAELN